MNRSNPGQLPAPLPASVKADIAAILAQAVVNEIRREEAETVRSPGGMNRQASKALKRQE